MVIMATQLFFKRCGLRCRVAQTFTLDKKIQTKMLMAPNLFCLFQTGYVTSLTLTATFGTAATSTLLETLLSRRDPLLN